MSLAQESLIDVLNRRFVCSYYNAFRGVGYDADGAALCKGKRVGYGAIFTPDGKMVVSFGYDMNEFYRALKSSLKQYPELARMTDDEQALVKRAGKSPNDLQVQLAAAKLFAALLDFQKSRVYLDRALVVAPNEKARVVVRYWKAHFALLEAELRMRTQSPSRRTAAARDGGREKVRPLLTALKGLPSDLEDDRVLDLISIDIELTPRPGFFTGWRLKPNADKESIIRTLKAWIVKAPASNRIGQMYFFLGVAYASNKEIKQANAAWKRHVDKYPQDRFAMLSRLQHSSYRFSPLRIGGQRSIFGGSRSTPQGKKKKTP